MKTQRIIYLDNIKVFLTCMVVAHHAAQAYGNTGGAWAVIDTQQDSWFKYFFFINASYMMGLFFFISGYFFALSLSKKTKKIIILERLKRLGIPLLFFMISVFLPFNYLSQDGQKNILEILKETYFLKPPLAIGHLWFVASLLVYSFIYLFFSKETIQPVFQLKKMKLTYLLIVIFLIYTISTLLRINYPIDHWETWLIPVEPAHLPQYFILFISGTLVFKQQFLNQISIKQSVLSGLIFLLTAILTFNFTNKINFFGKETFLETILCISISILLIGFFKKYFNKTNFLIKTISENAYGIYLFHLLIVIFLQKFILNYLWNANVKFILVTILGITISLAITILIRKNKFLKTII